jgi:Na+-translocating ferredoxin:NAD+ oxidoreductase RnfA subunit
MVNSLLILALLVTQNVLLTNGFGVLELQRGKINYYFVLLNSFCMLIMLLAGTACYSALYTYLLDPYNVEELGILVIVLLSGGFGFVELQLIKLINKEMYYYYDASYSYVTNLGVLVGVLYIINVADGVLQALFEATIVGISYIVVSPLFALVYSRVHSKKISRNFRPVPITIFTMAVLSMVIYAISICV